MSGWDRLGDGIATLAAASLAWVSSLLAFDLPADAAEMARAISPERDHQNVMIGWAQQVDEQPIAQVGEGPGDIESLDEGTAAAVDSPSGEDTELLDQGSPPPAQSEDAELLDQGSSLAGDATVAESSLPTSEVAAPVTSYAAPESAAASGPVIPEGFGTGTVHVSTGSAGFPIGLEDCHVGAVTGRAYVGIDCGDGNSVVGHAPSFENFPFVLEEGFPFDGASAPANLSEDIASGASNIFVSASQAAFAPDEVVTPEVKTSGPSSVELKQEAHGRKPRIVNESRGSKRSKDSSTGGNANVVRSSSDNNFARRDAETNGNKQNGDRAKRNRANSGNEHKKSKNSKNGKNAKKQSGKKNGGHTGAKQH